MLVTREESKVSWSNSNESAAEAGREVLTGEEREKTDKTNMALKPC